MPSNQKVSKTDRRFEIVDDLSETLPVLDGELELFEAHLFDILIEMTQHQ